VIADQFDRGVIYSAYLEHVGEEKLYVVVSNNGRNRSLSTALAARTTTSRKPQTSSTVPGFKRQTKEQGSVPAVWGSVLVLAFLIALDPLRLGLIVLVISRPRPVQNLLAYWAGCLTVNLPALLVPLTLLHTTPMFKSLTQDLATNSTARHIQIGAGVLALSIAALMTVRFLARRPAKLPTPGGNTSTLVLDSNTPPVISRLLGRAQAAATEGGSAVRRLLRRVHNAWENGSLWVALVIGLGLGGVAPDLVLFVLTIIVSSGAAISTQVSAAIAFVVGVLAFVEITLVSYLAMPAKTQAVLRPLHDWALAHRRQILVAMVAVGGVALVTNGMGSI
jgi:hypothetical protein